MADEHHKTLNDYIGRLLPIGFANVVIGIGFLVGLYAVTGRDSLVNIPFEIFGILLGYYCVTYVDPGGRVNFHLYSNRKETDSEKKIYQLVASHRSVGILRITCIALIALTAIVNVAHYKHQNNFDLSGVVWLVFWTTLTMLMLGIGEKQISAWWNIRKHTEHGAK